MNGRRMFQMYRYDNHWYAPCHERRLAAGPFLPSSLNWSEKHVKLGSEFRLVRYVGGARIERAGLAAAWVRGNSMNGHGICDGNLVIFQRFEFDHLHNNNIVVVERLGEEEGFGSWALKKIVIRWPRAGLYGECGEPIHWNDPEIVLYSRNTTVSPHKLDPTGQYAVRGLYRRALADHEVRTMDSEILEYLVNAK
jgi:hypothetical protein